MAERDYTGFMTQPTEKMKNKWRKHDVSALIDEKILVIGDGYRAKNSELSSTGIPFARVGNIKDGFQFLDADHFPVDQLNKVGEKISRPGDTVFTSKGTVGRFAFVTDDTPRFVYSPQLSFWRSLDSTVLEPRFLHYWMTAGEFYDQYKSVAGQTDMAEYVSLRDQRRMYITLPPVAKQRTIAHALGTLDDKIELNRRLNNTLEDMARALFKSWFVDFDPVRAKMKGRWRRGESLLGLSAENYDFFPDRLVESELGEIPEGWEVKTLEMIATFLNGLAMQRFPDNGGPTLPVIKIAQLRAGNTLTADSVCASIPSKYIIRDGDVLFSWSGSLELSIWAGGNGALNQHLYKVSSELYPQWFYYYWVGEHLEDFRDIAANKATTMGHIQRLHLSEALVVVPNSSLLDSICTAPLTGTQR